MATHSSTIARKIPWMEEPGRLQAMGSQRGGHDGETSLHLKADSQCWDSLRHTAEWLSHTHTCVHSPQLPSHPGCHIHWAEFPVIPSRSLLVNHFKYSSVYMSIPNSLTAFPCLLCPWQPWYWRLPSQWDKCKDYSTPVFSVLPVWVFMGHIPVPLFLSWFLLVTFPWFSNSHWVLFNNLWVILRYFPSVQFSSDPQSCPTLCDPVDPSMLGFPVHHQLPEFTQTHVHWVGDAIKPSHPLSSLSPPAFNLSQHQNLFKWVSSLHQVAKVLESQLEHQSFQWTLRTDLL